MWNCGRELSARLGYSSAARRGSSQGVIDWARLHHGGLRMGLCRRSDWLGGGKLGEGMGVGGA